MPAADYTVASGIFNVCLGHDAADWEAHVAATLAQISAASQRAQFTALKYEIEEMRRHPNIVGYIITEFTDVHWESNGLLDMCRNPKSYYEVIRQVNSPDVIVPEWERIAFWGEQKGGHRDIWTVAKSGGDPTPVTDDEAMDWNPVW